MAPMAIPSCVAIVDELGQLRRDKEEDKNLLTQLSKLSEQTANLASVEKQLNEFCLRVGENLDASTIQTKRLALDVFDVQVVATPEELVIEAVIPRIYYH